MMSLIQQAIDNYDLSDIINTVIIIVLLSIIWAQSNIRIKWNRNEW